jgi:hypothetical protein
MNPTKPKPTDEGLKIRYEKVYDLIYFAHHYEFYVKDVKLYGTKIQQDQMQQETSMVKAQKIWLRVMQKHIQNIYPLKSTQQDFCKIC